MGIGTLSPTEWLDVDGNIRTRKDVLADGRMVATGQVSAGGLTTSGSLAVSGIGYVVGDITTNTGMIINNNAGTLTFKTGGDDKGFVQLSGDNLRIGTFSANTNGRIILRAGGTDRLTVFENGNINIGSTTSHAAKLRVSGDLSVQDDVNVQNDVKVAGKVTRSNIAGDKDFLPFCFGKIAENGAIISGSGNFTVSTTSYLPGIYEITCTGINSNVVFVATAAQFGATVWMKYESGSTVKVYCSALYNGSNSNTPFSFVMYRGN